MNYKERYKEALERARAIYQGKYKPEMAATIAEILQSIFPELAESENERIRNMLIENFSRMAMHSEWGAINAVQVSDILAWLEKQGEQKSQRIISAEAKEDLFNYTNILSAEENTTLENLINKLAVSGIKQYNTQVATILFKN